MHGTLDIDSKLGGQRGGHVPQRVYHAPSAAAVKKEVPQAPEGAQRLRPDIDEARHAVILGLVGLHLRELDRQAGDLRDSLPSRSREEAPLRSSAEAFIVTSFMSITARAS